MSITVAILNVVWLSTCCMKLSSVVLSGISFPALTVFTKDAASLSNIMDSMVKIDSAEVDQKRKRCVECWKFLKTVTGDSLLRPSVEILQPSPLDGFCQQTKNNHFIVIGRIFYSIWPRISLISLSVLPSKKGIKNDIFKTTVRNVSNFYRPFCILYLNILTFKFENYFLDFDMWLKWLVMSQ